MVFNNATTTRWKEDDSNKWTEVVSKKKQHQQQQQQQLQQQLQQQQQQQQHGVDDPFAGMKSCVDYEQEIERLKQLVPKVPADSQHKKRPSLEKKFNTNTNTNTTSNTAASIATTSNHTSNNHNFLNNEFINTNNTTSTIASPTPTTPTTLTTTSTSNATNNPTSAASTISRSNSPDTTHSSDSDVSSVLSDHQIVTEEEKLRFLAFVRSWTGDWRKGAMMDDLTSSSNSLWADQSPWSRRHNVQSQQYYSYQQPTMLNKHGQQPIGMGRKTHHHQQSFDYAL